jgi:hypothetical protein
MTRAGSKKMC